MINNFDFTTETLGELDGLVKNRENAFDLLLKNLKENGFTDVDSTRVVARLQTQYIAENRKAGDLKTKEDWDQKEYYEPNEVNDNIPEVTNGKYSSFALVKVDDSTELNFPLSEDYSSIYEPFEAKSFSDVSLATNISNLVEKLGLIVKQNDLYKSSVYKHGLVGRTFAKVKNQALRIAKKPASIVGRFSGKISLKTRINNYEISNVEKIAKIYDFILGVAIKNESKNFKKQMGNKSKEIKYVARLFADVLMARVNDLGNVNNNKKLEKCIWLQFANALNKYNFDSNQLKVITDLGLQATLSTCKSLGINKEKIVERMKALGYIYTCVPSDELQALTEIKQKDYSVYMQNKFGKKYEEPELTFVRTINQTASKDDRAKLDKIVETKQNIDTINNSNSIQKTKGQARAQVKKHTVEKMIDKSTIKFLADQGTKIAEKINVSKVKGKKLKIAQAELNLYNLILSYYVQATNAKQMSVKNEGTYNENEISKAKAIAKALIIRRKDLAEKISCCDLQKGNQSSTAYINSVCKSLCNQSIREHFVKIIKGCVEYCIKTQFDTNENSSSEEKEIDEILESANEYLTNVEKAEKTDYVPDFIIVDKGEPPKSELKPNFVFVKDGEEQTK